MGLFRSKSRYTAAVEAAWTPPYPVSDTGRRYRDALLGGDATGATSILRNCMDQDTVGSDELMVRSARVLMALDAQRWDEAADDLKGWRSDHPAHYFENCPRFVEASAQYIARGLGLVGFLADPASQTHPRYDELLDDDFRLVTKAVRSASGPGIHGMPPWPVRANFDPVFAELKSARAMRRM